MIVFVETDDWGSVKITKKELVSLIERVESKAFERGYNQGLARSSEALEPQFISNEGEEILEALSNLPEFEEPSDLNRECTLLTLKGDTSM